VLLALWDRSDPEANPPILQRECLFADIAVPLHIPQPKKYVGDLLGDASCYPAEVFFSFFFLFLPGA